MAPEPVKVEDGFTLDNVQEWGKKPDSQEYRLVRERPYIRFGAAGQAPVYVQSGKVYGEGGDPMPELPDWVEPALAQMTPEARAAVGLPVLGNSVGRR
jgi:hypothetical protein